MGEQVGIADLPSLAVEPPTTSIVVETVTTIAFLYDLIRENIDTLQTADLERLVELGEAARKELTKRDSAVGEEKETRVKPQPTRVKP